jgi:hypothetical protein
MITERPPLPGIIDIFGFFAISRLVCMSTGVDREKGPMLAFCRAYLTRRFRRK